MSLSFSIASSICPSPPVMSFDAKSRTNREFWNEHAESIYSQEWVRKLSGQVADCLQSNIDWIEIRRSPPPPPPPSASSSPPTSPVKLLDYACGFGAVSTALLEHADVIRGIDVSDYMVDAYNQLAAQLGAFPQRMSAVQGNVLDDEYYNGSSAAMNGPDLLDVDAVVMTMALHHIQDPVALLSKLVQRLRPGGVLVIIDWLAPGAQGASVEGVGAGLAHSSTHLHVAHGHSHGHDIGDDHDHSHSHDHQHSHGSVHPQVHSTITRDSFSENELRDMFQAAGCDESSFALRPHIEPSLVPEHGSDIQGGVRRQLFIAKARKPASSS
ncbi:S-adenosyl-L-methionine-dependent methyltransferase [Nemania sp. NC0429]|nr:S-adenosyl-L-methionine-dependent methyltransferase [Nemania sp. NC0429]